jgi:precorrin-2 dehydrogenase / sirohydrochlorin ferrochelatase
VPEGPLYPVVLRVADRPCLVVGGGPVAARKVADLCSCGARVTVVAPLVHPAIEALASQGASAPTIERRPYAAGEAAHYRLVVTATGVAAVDRAVAADAEAAGVWVNSADDASHCTFFLPSVHRDGAVTVSVSTGGSSPALAAWLRRRLGDLLGAHLDELAQLLDAGRDALRTAGRPTGAVDWAALLDGELPQLVAEGRVDEARALIAAAVAAAG